MTVYFLFATLPPLPQQALKSITGRKMGEGGRSFQPHQVDRLTEVPAEGNWSLWKEANTERKRELLTKRVFHFQTHWTLCTTSAPLEAAPTSEGKNACEMMITAERSLPPHHHHRPVGELEKSGRQRNYRAASSGRTCSRTVVRRLHAISASHPHGYD